MTFIVEDGTGIEDANAYCDIAFVTDYASKLGKTFTGDQSQQEFSIQSATSHVDLKWGRKFRGSLLRSSQGLEFPRSNLYDHHNRPIEGLPTDFKEAVARYAIEHRDKGTLEVVVTNDTSKVKKKKVTVGPITTETEWDPSTTKAPSVKIPASDAVFKQYVFITTGGTYR